MKTRRQVDGFLLVLALLLITGCGEQRFRYLCPQKSFLKVFCLPVLKPSDRYYKCRRIMDAMRARKSKR